MPEEDLLLLPDGTALRRKVGGNLTIYGREGGEVSIENADLYRVMVWMFDSYLTGPLSPRSI